MITGTIDGIPFSLNETQITIQGSEALNFAWTQKVRIIWEDIRRAPLTDEPEKAIARRLLIMEGYEVNLTADLRIEEPGAIDGENQVVY